MGQALERTTAGWAAATLKPEARLQISPARPRRSTPPGQATLYWPWRPPLLMDDADDAVGAERVATAHSGAHSRWRRAPRPVTATAHPGLAARSFRTAQPGEAGGGRGGTRRRGVVLHARAAVAPQHLHGDVVRHDPMVVAERRRSGRVLRDLSQSGAQPRTQGRVRVCRRSRVLRSERPAP